MGLEILNKIEQENNIIKEAVTAQPEVKKNPLA